MVVQRQQYIQNENENIQTMKHLLWDCDHIKNFWTNLGTKLHVQFTYKLLILGSDDFCANYSFSVLKYLIYKKFLIDKDIQPQSRLILGGYMEEELKNKSTIFNANARTAEDTIQLVNIIDLL